MLTLPLFYRSDFGAYLHFICDHLSVFCLTLQCPGFADVGGESLFLHRQSLGLCPGSQHAAGHRDEAGCR